MLARLLGRWFDSALAILGRHPPLARRLLGALVAYLRLTPIRLGQRSLLAFCTRSLLPTLPPFDDAVVPLRACDAVRLRCFQLGGSHKADILSEWLLLTGVWQPALTSYLLRALSPGDTLIDVGATAEEEGELTRRQEETAGQVAAARRAHERASAEVRRSQELLAQKRSSRDALGLDEAAVKRLKTAHGIGDADAASASVTGAVPPNTLGQRLRAKVAQLEERLTVRVRSVDGEEAERRRFGDFPIPLEPDDNSRVWLELRPLSDGAQGPHGIFKVYSRGGEEHAEGPLGEQTLSPDPEGEYLLDALQPAVESGRVESLFESGRVADERLSDILAALLPSWFGADCVVLARPPATALPPPSFFARLKAKHLDPLTSPPPALLPPPPAAAAAPPEEDADSGLLKLGPGGSLHPPFDGASFLVNRICCDGAAARTAWYRALGGYGDAIVFDKSSTMIDSDAPASSLLVALEDDAGVLGGGGGGYAVRSSDGGMGALAKPASSACRLGRLTEADEEQALSGTAEGRRVVEFERAASELSELERADREAEEEEASAGRARREAECDLRLLEQELIPLRNEVEQLQQQLGVGGTGTGTGGGRGRGRKRARQGAA